MCLEKQIAQVDSIDSIDGIDGIDGIYVMMQYAKGNSCGVGATIYRCQSLTSCLHIVLSLPVSGVQVFQVDWLE